MSISLYRGQVDRLTKELADLRCKLSAEDAKVTEAKGKARRAAESLSRASSDSMIRSRGREVERHEKAAVDHAKRAERKRKAELDLGRAQRFPFSQRSASRSEKLREGTIKIALIPGHPSSAAHAREIERLRRASQPEPAGLVARPASPRRSQRVDSTFDEHYDVCLSFAGEQRAYVELVAQGLKDAGVTVFYDQDEAIRPRIWGRELTEYLDYVYRVGSRVCLMFISKEYAEKEFTRHERRSALDRAMREAGEYILPVRFDDTELPGLRPSIGYLDLRDFAPATLVDLVVAKLRDGQ